jgi:hypothetical protein
VIAAPPISIPTPPDPAWGWTIAWVGAWPLAIGLVIAAIACARELRPSRRDWLVIAGVLAAALALRLVLGVWAPLHINGQGPLWIGAAAGRPSMLVGYGPGYAELFAPIVAMFPRAPDLAIFTANAVLSACVPVTAFALGRLAGLPLDRAGFAAAILVVDPIAVRFAATESYFVPIMALVAATTTVIAASVRTRTPWRRGALLVAAAAFAIQTARIHPVAWIPLVLCPLGALLPPAPPARRLAGVAIAALVIAIAFATTSAGWIATLGGHATRYGDTISHEIGRAWVLLLIAIVFVVVRSRHWPLVVVATAALVADAILRPVYGQSDVWQASFDRLFLVVPVVAIAATIPSGLFGARARLVLTAAVAIAALLRGWPLRAPTTEQLEYRWLRDELARLDPACRVASLTRAGQRVHYLPWYVMDAETSGPTPTRWISVRDAAGLVAATRGGRCLVWAHTSLCESVDGRPTCTAIEHAAGLTELASTELPAAPSADPYPYDVDAVHVSLHRVQAR